MSSEFLNPRSFLESAPNLCRTHISNVKPPKIMASVCMPLHTCKKHHIKYHIYALVFRLESVEGREGGAA
jgi:hypothetical protein